MGLHEYVKMAYWIKHTDKPKFVNLKTYHDIKYWKYYTGFSHKMGILGIFGSWIFGLNFGEEVFRSRRFYLF